MARASGWLVKPGRHPTVGGVKTRTGQRWCGGADLGQPGQLHGRGPQTKAAKMPPLAQANLDQGAQAAAASGTATAARTTTATRNTHDLG